MIGVVEYPSEIQNCINEDKHANIVFNVSEKLNKQMVSRLKRGYNSEPITLTLDDALGGKTT